MSIYLVRHAKAESRQRWEGPDDLRPLTKAGRRQADAFAGMLTDTAIGTISSSPAVRCRETLEPLAHMRRLPIGLDSALEEGSDLDDLLKLLRDIGEDSAVLCSHGDVIGNLLAHLESRKVPLGGEIRFPKGSTWVLNLDGGEVTSARYLPPA